MLIEALIEYYYGFHVSSQELKHPVNATKTTTKTKHLNSHTVIELKQPNMPVSLTHIFGWSPLFEKIKEPEKLRFGLVK